MAEVDRERIVITAGFAFLIATLAATLFIRRPPRTSDRPVSQERSVSATILQLNDVYEMYPIDGQGGLARVATLRRQLEAENRNTIAVLAGDLVSPSALAQARVDGRPLAGRQMVDLMSRVGLNYAVFGNHEFDLNKDEFLARVSESKFTWIGSNVLDSNGHPFAGTQQDTVVTFTGEDGAQMRVGLFGLTIDSTVKDYVRYTDAIAAARAEVAALAARADVIVALTHLPLAEDEAVVNAAPGINLVIGGHEHQNVYAKRGSHLTPIAKADSNARTVYVHRLRWDGRTRHVEIDSRLIPVTDTLVGDATVTSAANDWRDRAFDAFRKDGFEAQRVVTNITAELDGTEASVRTTCTPLTRMIGSGMVAAVPGAVAAVFNSGSIRIDDILRPGPVTEYDVLRVLPYKGTLSLARVSGGVLAKALEIGRGLRNSGGYLQTFGIDVDSQGHGTIGGKPLVASTDYPIAINDYLWDGRETPLALFKERDAERIEVKRDVAEWRKATIAALKAAPGGIACPSAQPAPKSATPPAP
jgi:5'-nucleotidase/UDP-sugar diphosphatase